MGQDRSAPPIYNSRHGKRKGHVIRTIHTRTPITTMYNSTMTLAAFSAESSQYNQQLDMNLDNSQLFQQFQATDMSFYNPYMVNQENLMTTGQQMQQYNGQYGYSSEVADWNNFENQWKAQDYQPIVGEVPVQNNMQNQMQTAQHMAPQYQGNDQMTQGSSMAAGLQSTFHVPSPGQSLQFPQQLPVPAYVNDPYQSSSQFQWQQPMATPSTSSSSSPSAIPTIKLINLAIWQKMAEQVHEMLVNNNGRHISPRLALSIDNLKKDAEYELRWKLVLTSTTKYQYKNGQWQEMPEKKEDGRLRLETIEIKEGWLAGQKMEEEYQELEAKVYSAGSKVAPMEEKQGKAQRIAQKAESERETMFSVVPMHKYIPVVSLYERTGNGETLVAQLCHPDTEFLAKTKIQNKELIALKAEYSKFCRKDFKKKNELKK